MSRDRDKKESGKDPAEKEEEEAGRLQEPREEAGSEPEVVEIGEEEEKASTEDRLEVLTSENADLIDAMLRLKAEFENYRKRMIKEQTRILETAESGMVKKLLPVIDNLERALSNSPGDGNDKGFHQGVEMVLEQLLGILQKEGLEVIDPQGSPFDPEQHEAMLVVETDECPEDTVVEVAQKGYRFHGLLLRPAMVKVSCRVQK